MRNVIRKTMLSWIGGAPAKNKKVALLIPQFNEWSNGWMMNRLEYFKSVAQKYPDLDVILIDDGSSDKSLTVIKEFKLRNPDTFHVAAVYPNANKVGALYLTASVIHHEMVILSDFDTDLCGLQNMGEILETLRKDTTLMGYYFRMLPHDGAGEIFRFQQLEYSLQRTLYKFHMKERSVAVMPGAGSCYKREVLLSIYHQHSGLRNGEDREATLIGMKLGYQTFYWDKVLTLTRTPPSFKSLVKQRIRWNLGYLETLHKESRFYREQCLKCSRFGLRTLVDICDTVFVVLMPFILIVIAIMIPQVVIPFLLIQYLLYMIYCFNSLVIFAPHEASEFADKRFRFMFYFPFLKIALDCLSWSGAIIKFTRKMSMEWNAGK